MHCVCILLSQLIEVIRRQTGKEAEVTARVIREEAMTSKIKIGQRIPASPMPAFIVGAFVDNKPNFLAIGWAGCVNRMPPMISVAVEHTRYTNRGIKQNQAFSMNLPSVDMVKETDFCGIVSGAEVNKAEICQFNIFYGERTNTPMIEQCPLNIECTVVHTIDLGSHDLFIGRIEETHIDEDCLADGKPDITRMKPFVLTTGYTNLYIGLSKTIGKAFSIGKVLKNQ
jgi:flavin reductase (DIM6/NTAB) family NADH-FMN oxidoreductase RutF